MKLHQLKKTSGKKPKTRVGRGGKRGTFAGRGTKGQRSRAGRRIRKAERDLILRLPKKRGFRNKPKSDKSKVFNLTQLLTALKPLLEKETGIFSVSIDILKQLRLIPNSYRGEIKILSKGEIDKPLKLVGLKTSKSVRIKIEKAGGTIE